jgi:hypothetical protein
MSTPENQTPTVRYCIHCGTPLQLDWNTCPNCGWVTNNWVINNTFYLPQQPNIPKGPLYGYAIASILCCVLSVYASYFRFFFGLFATVFGIIAVHKKSKWGYLGLAVGIAFMIISVVLYTIANYYPYDYYY